MGEVWANRGIARRGLNEPEKAVRAFINSVTWDPNQYEAQHVLGALLMLQQRPSDALPHLEAAVKLAPPDRLSRVQGDLAECVRMIRERSEALLKDAVEAERRGDSERALNLYKDAAAVRSNLAEAWQRAGHLLAHYRGNMRDGRTYVQEAIRILDAEKAATGRAEDTDTARVRAEAVADLKWIEEQRDAKDEDEPAPGTPR